MVKKMGKESTLFCLYSFKSHSTLNISYAKQFNYWPSSGNQQPLVFILRALPGVTRQKPPQQEMVVSGCSVAIWRSVNLLPGCVYTGHSNWKDPKTHGNHLKHVLCINMKFVGDCFGPWYFSSGAKNASVQNNHLQIHTMISKRWSTVIIV